jgi:hypothetical protein
LLSGGQGEGMIYPTVYSNTNTNVRFATGGNIRTDRWASGRIGWQRDFDGAQAPYDLTNLFEFPMQNSDIL